jgi:beta-glucuronidase
MSLIGGVSAAPLKIKDTGAPFPIDFEKFGSYVGAGTPNFKYKAKDRAAIAKAMGAGLYPNPGSIENEPDFQVWRKTNSGPINPWDQVNTGDAQADFYGWTLAKDVGPGVKLFFTAEALAAAGHYKQALKAYHAILVFFPGEPCWSADHSFVWYVGPAALGKIETITKHQNIGYRLKGAACLVENGSDVNLDNDVVTVNPGTWVKYTRSNKPGNVGKMIAQRGYGRVQLHQFEDRSWKLFVDKKPFFVRGVTYLPTLVGSHVSDGAANSWMSTDADENGRIDTAYESWIDSNGNHKRDSKEPLVGDFQLMKDMGVNTIRLFRGRQALEYDPSEFNKKLLREMNQKYGISAIMGDYLGAYTVGSGAEWEAGTDYTDPVQLKNMRELITAYVKDHRNEPYVLMWLLGNENLMDADYSGVNATRTRAATQVQAYLRFVNEIAELIHRLDPNHPVAIGNLDTTHLREYALYAPAVDIFGANSYLGAGGFGRLWKNVQDQYDRPVLVTEYGCDAFDSRNGREDEDMQALYHKGNWEDIQLNASGRGEEGNAIGGVVFEFMDEWWKSNNGPWDMHDSTQDSTMAFPDGWGSEEWYGLISQGDGSQSPLARYPRKAYYLYKDKLWKTH